MNIEVMISYTDENGVTYDSQSSVLNQFEDLPVVEVIINQVKSALKGLGYSDKVIDRYIGDTE